MVQRNARRGFAALALAATLGIAGAYPAAADPGFFERGLLWLAGLWGGEVAAERSDGGLFAAWASQSADKGMGLDPNGGTILAPPPPAPEDQEQ